MFDIRIFSENFEKLFYTGIFSTTLSRFFKADFIIMALFLKWAIWPMRLLFCDARIFCWFHCKIFFLRCLRKRPIKCWDSTVNMMCFLNATTPTKERLHLYMYILFQLFKRHIYQLHIYVRFFFIFILLFTL